MIWYDEENEFSDEDKAWLSDFMFDDEEGEVVVQEKVHGDDEE